MNKYHSSGREYTAQELEERREAFSPRYLVEGYPSHPNKILLLASGYVKAKPFRNPAKRTLQTLRVLKKRAIRKGASK